MRLSLIILLILATNSDAASRRTSNFIVETADQRDADEFAQLAEKYRREIAVTWLGKEMPTWDTPCRLTIYVRDSGAGGATSFQFGLTVYQEMKIEGARDRLKNSVLPHEVTHTVFAHHFRQPVPRWADEGGSVLSESERDSFDKLCRTILNDGRGIKLSSLFRMTEYPKDVMCLYTQGYSVTSYLVDLKDRKTFLDFVATGMSSGWDASVKKHYNLSSVDELERKWLDHFTPYKH